MSEVVCQWIVVEHPDTAQAAEFKPGRWIQIDDERMQIMGIEQLGNLRDRLLVARFPHHHPTE